MSAKNIHKEVTANWAREKSQENMSETLMLELTNIIIKIKEAVSNNKMEIYVNSVHNLVKVELNRRGFTVIYNPRTSSDPREGSFYIIKW